MNKPPNNNDNKDNKDDKDDIIRKAKEGIAAGLVIDVEAEDGETHKPETEIPKTRSGIRPKIALVIGAVIGLGIGGGGIGIHTLLKKSPVQSDSEPPASSAAPVGSTAKEDPEIHDIEVHPQTPEEEERSIKGLIQKSSSIDPKTVEETRGNFLKYSEFIDGLKILASDADPENLTEDSIKILLEKLENLLDVKTLRYQKSGIGDGYDWKIKNKEGKEEIISISILHHKSGGWDIGMEKNTQYPRQQVEVDFNPGGQVKSMRLRKNNSDKKKDSLYFQYRKKENAGTMHLLDYATKRRFSLMRGAQGNIIVAEKTDMEDVYNKKGERFYPQQERNLIGLYMTGSFGEQDDYSQEWYSKGLEKPFEIDVFEIEDQAAQARSSALRSEINPEKVREISGHFETFLEIYETLKKISPKGPRLKKSDMDTLFAVIEKIMPSGIPREEIEGRIKPGYKMLDGSIDPDSYTIYIKNPNEKRQKILSSSWWKKDGWKFYNDVGANSREYFAIRIAFDTDGNLERTGLTIMAADGTPETTYELKKDTREKPMTKITQTEYATSTMRGMVLDDASGKILVVQEEQSGTEGENRSRHYYSDDQEIPDSHLKKIW